MSIRKSVSGWVAATLVWATLIASPSQAAEPTVIISLKSYKELNADVQYVTGAIGMPQIGFLFPMLVTQPLGGQFPKGFDVNKPIIGYLSISEAGDAGSGAICIPVTNAKEFAKALGKVATNSSTEGEVTTFELPNLPSPLVGKAVAKYYVLSNTAESLQDAPDPATLAKTTADIAVEFKFDHLPDATKEQFLSGVESGMQERDQSSDSVAKKRFLQAWEKQSLAAFRRMIFDGERLSIGLNLDAAGHNVSLDLGITAKANTPFATACQNLSQCNTPFGGMISPKTVGSLVCSVPLAEDFGETIKLLMEAAREGAKEAAERNDEQSAADRELKLSVATQLIDASEQSLPTDRLDFALVFNVEENRKFQASMAHKVKTGKNLAAIVAEILKRVKSNSGTTQIDANVATVAGAAVHRLTPPADPESPFAEGPAHILVSEDIAAIAFGGDSLASIKNIFESTVAAKSAPIALRIKLGNLIPALPSQPNLPEEIVKAAFADGRDEISLQITGEPQKLKIRFEVQEGVLKLIGLSAQQQNQGGF